MRNKQPIAAKMLVAFDTMFWVAMWKKIREQASPDCHPLPNTPGRRVQIQNLAGGLHMVTADYWVLPLHAL